jgi:hypothetical protein
MKRHKSALVMAAAAAVLFLVAQVSSADITGSVDNVSIKFKIPCEAAVKTLTLGDISITLHEGANKWMEATFSVNANAQPGQPAAGKVWECMRLHWVQTIWHNDWPNDPKRAGVKPPVPVIDPAKGGWDYMYNDGATRKDPKDSDPAYGWFIDDLPWYYNTRGEKANSTDGKTYKVGDDPTDIPAATGYLGFSTYLVAEATQFCPKTPPNPDCLDDDEFLLLGGFDWTMSTADISLGGTFLGTAFDAGDVTTALGHAGFSGWTAVHDKIICCVPEPVSILLGMIGLAHVAAICRRWAA